MANDLIWRDIENQSQSSWTVVRMAIRGGHMWRRRKVYDRRQSNIASEKNIHKIIDKMRGVKHKWHIKALNSRYCNINKHLEVMQCILLHLWAVKGNYPWRGFFEAICKSKSNQRIFIAGESLKGSAREWPAIGGNKLAVTGILITQYINARKIIKRKNVSGI